MAVKKREVVSAAKRQSVIATDTSRTLAKRKAAAKKVFAKSRKSSKEALKSSKTVKAGKVTTLKKGTVKISDKQRVDSSSRGVRTTKTRVGDKTVVTKRGYTSGYYAEDPNSPAGRLGFGSKGKVMDYSAKETTTSASGKKSSKTTYPSGSRLKRNRDINVKAKKRS